MDEKKEILSNIYNTLVQVRYPCITTVTTENIEEKILQGGNRISSDLLITEKLLQYYSNIGICNDKDLLLGKCTLQEQFPTLRVLLNFAKFMYIESSDGEYTKKESIDDILQVFSNEDLNTMTSIIEPKLNYSESLKYFDELKKFLDEHQNLNSNSECEKEGNANGDELQGIKKISEGDRDLLFDSENKKFLEAFSTIDSWPTAKEESINSLYSMDSDMKDIYSNFSSLIQFLKTKNEICNSVIPEGLEKMITPLNEIIEDTLISTEKTMDVYSRPRTL
ncbi:PREDICTED: uncharacterized protein LOC107186356 [Dufourea novaeangliae]|uniref:uncharacterized protein LOC107186356 n=1 Tax=Dufourea novaeangliae TaxID=178035 RepID=UPI000767498F|nr:PREDICTED: uncharacterized protein LOC107186356 [Dufourea novaeangliae]